MEQSRIIYLLERYMEDRLMPDEREELYMLSAKRNDPDTHKMMRGWIEQKIRDAPPETSGAPDLNHMDRILAGILSVDKTEATRPALLHKRPFYRRYLVAAACVALIAAMFGIWTRYPLQISKPGSAAVISDPGVPVEFTRSLKLPDGSIAILKGGSTLKYPEAFSGEKREVILNGEAYFDITHTGALPFVIYTGKVKTVVLGTSFNIRAYPGQNDIVVSVTRGKVRVEKDGGEILAVLTQDQQVVYNIEESEVQKTDTNAGQANDWVKNDMEFDGIAFENIALLLEKRYNVRIDFENPALKKCLTVVSFSGMESLENVLETLCVIRDAGYTKTGDDQYVISGDSCE